MNIINREQYQFIYSPLTLLLLNAIFVVVGFGIGRYYEDKLWAENYADTMRREMVDRHIMIPDYMWDRMAKDGGVYLIIRPVGEVFGEWKEKPKVK